MTLSREQLFQRLQAAEWTDLEVKEAQWALPRTALETVSAFANTSGGYLVFGIKEEGRAYEIVGVIDVDKVQGNFLTQLNSRDKISCQLTIREGLLQEEDKAILTFFVGEAAKAQKPVCLDRDIRKSFIRRGGIDQRCSDEDIRRFLRAAGGPSYESEPVDLDLNSCIDADTLARYRRRFEAREPSHRCNDFDAAHFLEHWALTVQAGGTLRPTRAAILLFGTGAALRAMLPRPVVDCRWAAHAWDAPPPDQRWADRLVCEENLWTCWEQLADRYVQNAAKPFALEVATMERQERPEDFVSFREAAINLLMHQDFEESTRSATISFHPDRVVFENPGTARANTSALLEPGAKDVRNPLIIGMFRRVGLSEQAGTGISAIFGDWRRRGRVPPEIVNDVASYTFRLSLLVKELLSERQLLFQAALGVHLSDQEATALAILCGQAQVHLPEFRALLGIGSAELVPILNRLEAQVLATKSECPDGVCYQLSEHLRQRWPLVETPGTGSSLVSDQAGPESTNLVSDQAVAKPGRQLDHLTDDQYRVLAACDTPRQLTELMDLLGVKHRSQFRSFHLRPLLDGGLLQLQFYDKPTHPNQRYSLSEIGAEIVARHIKKGQDDGQQE